MGLPTLYYGDSKSITLPRAWRWQIDPNQIVTKNRSISGVEERLNIRLDLAVALGIRYLLTADDATVKRNFQQFLALAQEGRPWSLAIDSDEKVLTTLSASALEGDSTVHVTSAVGITPGKQYFIRGLTRGELVQVAPGGVTGTTITLVETLNNDWFSGDRFRSEMYWPGRLVKMENQLAEKPPIWFDIDLSFLEDVNDL